MSLILLKVKQLLNNIEQYDEKGVIAASEEWIDFNKYIKFDAPGFPNLSEPFLDVNENRIFNSGVLHVDSNINSVYKVESDSKPYDIVCQYKTYCSS